MSRYIATTILAVAAAVITANLVVSVEQPEHAPAVFMLRP